MSKRLTGFKKLIDPDTGEMKTFVLLDSEVKDKDFAKVKKALTEAVLRDLKDLNGAVFLLLWFIDKAIELKMFDRPVVIPATYEEISQQLKVSIVTAKRYVKALKEKKYLIQPKKRQLVYMLNPEFIWLGSAQSYVSYLKSKEDNKDHED